MIKLQQGSHTLLAEVKSNLEPEGVLRLRDQVTSATRTNCHKKCYTLFRISLRIQC